MAKRLATNHRPLVECAGLVDKHSLVCAAGCYPLVSADQRDEPDQKCNAGDALAFIRGAGGFFGCSCRWLARCRHSVRLDGFCCSHRLLGCRCDINLSDHTRRDCVIVDRLTHWLSGFEDREPPPNHRLGFGYAANAADARIFAASRHVVS